ncbi:DNA topoisomerase IB [Terracoccus luteus]|uniref:DNA topoisomerase IB n=1 Tax=Terracoccus luteus TaxID=53356 RepID=A0A839PTB0_9MICO|nr:DNA topoisomerase IB [Terracoccus luteus]MBB2986389.1 DNA topoisomerase IB [Terracoccus luteus]MCP2172021.1 DNA topoisomerase IB [Terracoccus luteus]
MRLRRSTIDGPGIHRVRRGKGWSYVDDDGVPVDADSRERAKALVVPPAWKGVWIAPHANGHIQAVGTDDAGRRQYIYHDAWHEARGREKHDRVLALAKKLPQARKQVAAELRSDGLTRMRVTAAALRMLDAGLFRSGGDEYEVEHGSHGVATLLRTHVTVSGDDITFEFPAKSGVTREAVMTDPLLASVVRSLKRCGYPGERLLVYRDEQRQWREVHSTDLNVAFKELVGPEYTVKDLRTWAATVTAAVTLAQSGVVTTERELKRAEKDAMKVVSEHLGNTPAVARRSYVDTRVLDEFAVGRTIERSLSRLTKADRQRLVAGDLVRVRDRDALERAVMRLLARAE